MEYVADHGTYADIPVERIVAAWAETYGEDRVQQWIKGFEASDGAARRDFDTEEAI